MRKTLAFLLPLFLLASCAGDPGASSAEETSLDSSSSSSIPVDPEILSFTPSPDYPAIADSVPYVSYYFDGDAGNDANDGLSPENPKRTLGAASSLVKSVAADSPTKVLLKAGSTFSGKLTLERFKALPESPLIVDSYEKSEEAPYAKILGNENDSVVEVKASNIRLGGLELTAPLGFRGIHVTTASKGAMENVVIHDNYLHALNFDLGDHVLPTDLE